MATTKTKASDAPTEPEDKPEEQSEPDDDTLTAKIKAVVEEVLAAKPEVEVEKADDAKRPTLREEEASMNDRVKKAVAEFLKKDDAPKPEPTKEPEKVPGSSATRWVEKWVWGKE